MWKLAATIICLALTAFCARADQAMSILQFGAGMESCATWNTPSHEIEGTAWIYGYWTASNVYRLQDSHQVGRSTDGLGIIAAVRNKCRDDPSQTLLFVTDSVFTDFHEKER